MKDSRYLLDGNDPEKSLLLKDTLQKYLRYWPWFVIAVVIGLIVGYVYVRYATVTYRSVAKVKIIDETTDLNFTADPVSVLSGAPKINLDNEIEVLKSYRIISQVVEELELDVSYYELGNIKNLQIFSPPFKIVKKIEEDSLNGAQEYYVSFEDKEVSITDDTGYTVTGDPKDIKTRRNGLPFNFELSDSVNVSAYRNKNYKVVLKPRMEAVLTLTDEVGVAPTNKNSEILELSILGESTERNEAILNTIIKKFDQDGIRDRQLISKRTVDFIDERFVYLANELDSIEGNKEDFKQSNNLSYIEADAGASLQQKSIAEGQVNSLRTQVSLSRLLKETLSGEDPYALLPADIGLESPSINRLVTEYNRIALERQRLISSAGINNPALQVLSGQLERGKQNIIETVNVYQRQLEVSLNQLNRQKYQAGSMFSSLPEKEKILNAIERQQGIKESLYILLLQKREEAAINFAVTAPTLKVVDYGLTGIKPVSPDKKIVFGGALLLGIFVPFLILFLKFFFETKVRSRNDIEKIAPGIPVLSEIPYFKEDQKILKANNRSLAAESFRILSTNINYLLPEKNKKEAQVIYVTSTIKEEGKTLISMNLSLAYASIKKKVLLVGADLRNPQLHSYFKVDKSTVGLSNYLYDPTTNLHDCIYEGFGDNEYHQVCFSGSIPPNAPELLSSDAFGIFMETVKQEYDYIIVDTAPTLLVTDTLIISKYADATLFVVRAGKTDKRLIQYSKELTASKKLKNMAYILNDVSLTKDNGYNYGYGYGYEARENDETWWGKLKDVLSLKGTDR